MKLCEELLSGLPPRVLKRLEKIKVQLAEDGITDDVIAEVEQGLMDRVKELQSVEKKKVVDIHADDYLVVLKKAGVPNAIALKFSLTV